MAYAGASSEFVELRKHFQRKIDMLNTRMDMFELDPYVYNVSRLSNTAKIYYRCKEHKLSCFSVQPYWNNVALMAKGSESAKDHVDFVKKYYDYDIEEYELVETLREVDSYDPFDVETDSAEGPCHTCLRKLYTREDRPQGFSPIEGLTDKGLRPAFQASRGVLPIHETVDSMRLMSIPGLPMLPSGAFRPKIVLQQHGQTPMAAPVAGAGGGK